MLNVRVFKQTAWWAKLHSQNILKSIFVSSGTLLVHARWSETSSSPWQYESISGLCSFGGSTWLCCSTNSTLQNGMSMWLCGGFWMPNLCMQWVAANGISLFCGIVHVEYEIWISFTSLSKLFVVFGNFYAKSVNAVTYCRGKSLVQSCCLVGLFVLAHLVQNTPILRLFVHCMTCMVLSRI